jgi:hypothetical protein
MRWTRKTVDAAMLATPVGINRAIKGDIRRRIARDDLARRLKAYFGTNAWQVFCDLPAIINTVSVKPFEPSRAVRLGGAATGIWVSGMRVLRHYHATRTKHEPHQSKNVMLEYAFLA